MPKQIFEHHLQEISNEELQEAVASYRKGLVSDPNETQSCMIDLNDLNHIIQEYSYPLSRDRRHIIGFRIYFFRGGKSNCLDEYTINKNGEMQLNIIMVPVCDNKDHSYLPISKGFAKDILTVEEKCWVLIPGGENTGLCPKNCNG